MGHKIRIFEVGPRDGLQNEKRLIPSSQKVELIDLLSQCGFERIEATSFVSPSWVPQMADAAEVMSAIRRRPGVRYAALTPNLQGYKRAKTAAADEVAIFVSASEGFSKRNINCSIGESLARYRQVLAAAGADGVPVRGYISCAIGAGTPAKVSAMLEAVLAASPPERLAGHYHDTGGLALENIVASLALGLRTFDAAVAGLGGCPYAPGAPGNVATEAVVRLCDVRGYETGFATKLKGGAP